MYRLRSYILKAPKRVITIHKRRTIARFKRQMITLQGALNQEKEETKEMLAIYKKYTQQKATSAEMRLANEQFIDILKGLGIGVFAVLPFAPITIPVIIAMAKKVNVDILPSSFSKPNSTKNS